MAELLRAQAFLGPIFLQCTPSVTFVITQSLSPNNSTAKEVTFEKITVSQLRWPKA